MGANDRAVRYAKERVAAALEVLGEMEWHARTPEARAYGRKLRDALAIGDVRIACSCADETCPGKR